jgi:hypothetical protein
LAFAQGGRKLVERLESKVRDIEEELEAKKRHSRDAIKMSRQLERNCKEMEYQCQEEKNECRSSLCFSWDFDGFWMARWDGNLGWARLTEKKKKINYLKWWPPKC